jgi:NAD(P)-dependent dehydrogenase (short-subunit alcohol dehydrogenase family)
MICLREFSFFFFFLLFTIILLGKNDWLIVCRINSKAAFFILKEAAAHVSEEGKIITIVTALLAAFTGFYTSYAGSKAPVEHFTKYALCP